MKLVSIIITAYNVEKYLQKCIESAVNQKYENIEIIIVDDGSTDNSDSIIKRYKEKYKNIKHYKKENGGIAETRNFAIKKSSGDYFCFIDGDDYVSENLISNLQKYICEDYDLIKYKAILVDKNYERIGNIPGPVFENYSGEEAFNELYSKDKLIEPPWMYLYKRSFWDENKFEYPEGTIHEDFGRTALIMLKAKKVASTSYYGYFYYQSDKSITRGYNEAKSYKGSEDMLKHYDYMINEIPKYDIQETTVDNVRIYYTNCLLQKAKDLRGKIRENYIQSLKEREIVKNIKARNIKQFVKKIILKIDINLYLKIS